MINECHTITLDSKLDLEKIKDLLSEDYSFIPQSLQNTDLIDDEKKLFNSWIEIGEIESILDDKVRVLRAKGRIEITSSAYNFKGTNDIKPKKDRINICLVDVAFLEILQCEGFKEVYALVLGSSTLKKNVKKHLLGGVRTFKKELKDKWGKFDGQNYLTFPPDFFLWFLISNEKNTLSKIDLDILDIHYVENQNEIKEERRHIDKGSDILSDILAKVSLSRNSNVLELGVHLDCRYGKFHFSFNSNGSISFSEQSFLYNDKKEIQRITEENAIELIIFIYGYVFPKLRTSYNEDISNMTWRNENILPFREKQGKMAFLELGKHLKILDISEQEIEEIVNKGRKIRAIIEELK